MLTTITVIVLLLIALAGGFQGWSQYVQRDQAPGRHRVPDRQKSTPSAA